MKLSPKNPGSNDTSYRVKISYNFVIFYETRMKLL